MPDSASRVRATRMVVIDLRIHWITTEGEVAEHDKILRKPNGISNLRVTQQFSNATAGFRAYQCGMWQACIAQALEQAGHQLGFCRIAELANSRHGCFDPIYGGNAVRMIIIDFRVDCGSCIILRRCYKNLITPCAL